MSTVLNELDILRDKIFAAADGRLRKRIDERLDVLRQDAGLIGNVTINGMPVTAISAVNAIADAAFRARRDTARQQAVDDFLQKVNRMKLGDVSE